ncbi:MULTISPECIES: TnsA-like heteromeric transposase endonuclease subunit [Rhodococcus]|uniref:TnsA-like heteromeric transposase endonuclease subunit n=1 Tax=Rhodococcus TaxID=1827 RepID=UPI0029553D2C|nr:MULTISPECIES: TnsA-like heteromeric transposase endonuclease subunit [Rhodococcus]MDV7246275.1 TnsA-like heteromeric transposase endonuclease subunit [Rhodococcus oxybenzonivorans]MDV7337253.1 TnsA-like heteromeric transposase endonuclease subunit [Rhodococcus oxybenzonivorans]MDV8030807.1 TnsA-like heteromeric transposase endonuclease subunit [Rhodococcus sp. IEGM 27]
MADAGTALRAVSGGVSGGELRGFEVAFTDPDGDEVRGPLSAAAAVAFERVSPVRRFPSYRGQRSNPGFYYSETTGAHVPFESWLERDEAMALDFDENVVGFAAQPLWLFWSDGVRARSHAPDFFARMSGGRGVVIDCRPAERIKPRDEAAFAATGRACEQMGWGYRLVTGHDPVWLANVVWLAGYRHRRHRIEPTVSALLAAFTEPRPLIEGARSVGDPIAVLPALYHLLWSRELVVDLAVRLEGWSIVAGVGR